MQTKHRGDVFRAGQIAEDQKEALLPAMTGPQSGNENRIKGLDTGEHAVHDQSCAWGRRGTPLVSGVGMSI